MKKQKNTDENSCSEFDENVSREHTENADQLSPNSGVTSPLIKPVREKIGESGDNLRRRGDWFQRRSRNST